MFSCINHVANKLKTTEWTSKSNKPWLQQKRPYLPPCYLVIIAYLLLFYSVSLCHRKKKVSDYVKSSLCILFLLMLLDSRCGGHRSWGRNRVSSSVATNRHLRLQQWSHLLSGVPLPLALMCPISPKLWRVNKTNCYARTHVWPLENTSQKKKVKAKCQPHVPASRR